MGLLELLGCGLVLLHKHGRGHTRRRGSEAADELLQRGVVLEQQAQVGKSEFFATQPARLCIPELTELFQPLAAVFVQSVVVLLLSHGLRAPVRVSGRAFRGALAVGGAAAIG